MSEPIEPIASYADWMAAPAQTSMHVESVTAELWQSAGFWGMAAAGGLVLLGLAKNIPVWGPMVHSAGTSLLNLIRPKDRQKAQERAQIMEHTAWGIINQVEKLPAHDQLVQQLKRMIKENTPDEFEAIFAAWKKDLDPNEGGA